MDVIMVVTTLTLFSFHILYHSGKFFMVTDYREKHINKQKFLCRTFIKIK